MERSETRSFGLVPERFPHAYSIKIIMNWQSTNPPQMPMSAAMEPTVVSKYATTPLAPTTVCVTLDMHSIIMDIHVEVSIFLLTFKLFNVISADVNECLEEIDTCDQDCENIIGSYLCGCSSGFILDFNGKSCNGKCMSVSE